MQPDQGFDRVCVIGAGVVGGALLTYLRDQGVDAQAFDPPKGLGTPESIERAGAVFVCVPTPYTAGRGFDDSFLLSAMAHIGGSKLVIIKSTVLPGTTELLQERFPQHRLVFNPEFLREATAFDDFVHPDRQIVGCTGASAADGERVMAMLPRAPYELICSASEAEMAKYMANSLLAVKVSFANEMFDLCARLGIDYGPVKSIVAADERIGPSHLDVFDGGYRGYGGKCLPKDSRALLDLAQACGAELRVLRATDQVNSLLRGENAPHPRVLQPLTNSNAQERAA